MPAHEWADKGRAYRMTHTDVAFESCVGFAGFYSGPEVHMYDGYALTEPLLARLPANPNPEWRIGHLPRTTPFGYDRTLMSDSNVIKDSGAALYCDKLRTITREPLLSIGRLKTIIAMNMGRYDYLLNNYWDSTSLSVDYHSFDSVKAEGTVWDAPGNIVIRRGGLTIALDSLYALPYAEFTSDHNDYYALAFYRDSVLLGRIDVSQRRTEKGGLRLETVDVPPLALRSGYNKVQIFPVTGDDAYSIGHFRLLEKKTSN
jgi:arabinofuranosyltransferase